MNRFFNKIIETVMHQYKKPLGDEVKRLSYMSYNKTCEIMTFILGE